MIRIGNQESLHESMKLSKLHLTHHIHIFEMNSESYLFHESMKKTDKNYSDTPRNPFDRPYRVLDQTGNIGF